MAEASCPEDLLYHPEHDWAKIDPAQPDVAMLTQPAYLELLS